MGALAVPPRGQQLQRQARVGVGQPPPRRQHVDEVDEGAGVVAGPVVPGQPPGADRLEAVEEVGVELLEPVEVPPGRDEPGQVATRDVRTGEGLREPGQPGPLQRLDRRGLQVPRRDPGAGGDGAETEPGQRRTQLVALGTLGVGHREHDEQPAVVGGAAGVAEDADVALGEQAMGVVGEGVPGGVGAALRVDQAAALEPVDRRPHGLHVDPDLAEQPYEPGDRQPAAAFARVEAVHGEDQPAGLACSTSAVLVLDRHGHNSTGALHRRRCSVSDGSSPNRSR